MSETFDSSVARGVKRGEELAAMDAAVAAFQQDFLALCREWFRRYREIVEVESARFDLYGIAPGNLQVTVTADGSVMAYGGQVGRVALGGDARVFSRPFLGHYENSMNPAALEAAIARIRILAERGMASVLEQVAMDVTRRGGGAAFG